MGIKGLKPSLREKKRYIAFEVISKSKVSSLSRIQKAVTLSMISYKGAHGLAESGLMFVPERYNPNNQRGIARVNRKKVNDAIAAMTLTHDIDGAEVIMRTLGVSGMINKAGKLIAS